MARYVTSVINGAGNDVMLGGRGRGCGRAHIRGWDAGVKVEPVNVKGKPDELRIYMTRGSHGGENGPLIGTVYDTPNGPAFVAAGDDLPDDDDDIRAADDAALARVEGSIYP
jgi:hypothetical protein